VNEPVDIAALQGAGLFKGLDDDAIVALLSAGEPVTVAAGTAVFTQGDAGDAMYVVTGGEARVDTGGRFHILRKGDFFGEMAVVAPGPRMATVMAATDLSAIQIPGSAFAAFVTGHPDVSLAIMRGLALRLREVEQRLDAWMA